MTSSRTLAMVAGIAALVSGAPLPARAQLREGQAAEQAGHLSEALQAYVSALRALPDPPPLYVDYRLRRAIIRVAARVTPAPALPDEVSMAMERGRTFVRVATDTMDFVRAAREFRSAVRAAPWYPGAMLNLAIVYERLHQYFHAVGNLRLFLQAAPNDPQAAAARTKLAELEVLEERTADSIPWQKSHTGHWDVLQRSLEGVPEVVLSSESHGAYLNLRCRRGAPDVFINWAKPVGDHPVITYRAGSGTPVHETWTGSTQGTGAFFPGDPLLFLRDLEASDELQAQVTTSDGHELRVSFGTSGLARAAPPLVAACAGAEESPAAATASTEGSPYTDSLFRAVQELARAPADELPRAVRYLEFAEGVSPLRDLIATEDSTPARFAFTVFQIRYRDRWVMVDAGFDRPLLSERLPHMPATWWQNRADSLAPALRGAQLVVLTHEHWDHAAGAELGADALANASHTILTQSQLRALQNPPAPRLYVVLPRDPAPSYEVVDDDMLRDIAPGVVMIRAPGHSPGSQLFYIHPASGKDLLLVGDLVWNVAGLERNRQRPPVNIRELLEDVPAIQQQLDWVRRITQRGDVIAIPSHDGQWLSALAARGVIASGLDLGP